MILSGFSILNTIPFQRTNQNREERRKQNKKLEKKFHGNVASSDNIVERKLNTYSIKPGDYLSVVAKKLDVPLQTLLKDNNLTLNSIIHPGDTLKYYTELKKDNSFKELEIKPGDNLTKISKENNIPLEELVKYNNITNPNLIQIGQKIKIPVDTPSEYRWKDVSKYEQDINNKYGKDYKGLINHYYTINKTGEFYIIDDKKNNKLGIYKNGKLVKQFNAIHGANGNQNKWTDYQKSIYKGANIGEQDNYTITRYKKDANGNYILDSKGKRIIDDASGNLSTPAGKYYSEISNSLYRGFPSWVRYSDKKDPSNSLVPSSIHHRSVIASGRYTNGCTGMSGEDLLEMQRILGTQHKPIPTYILPNDSSSNKFFIRNGQLNFSSSSKAKPWTKNGVEQKDYKGNTIITSPQLNGINKGYRSSIRFEFDQIDVNGDKYSPQQINVVKSFIKGLSDNKQQLMSDLGINDDTYNNLASRALGILGRESSYGKRHGEIENGVKSFSKVLGLSNTSPDIYRKYEGYFGYAPARNNNNSIGLTQMRLSELTNDELSLLKKYNITKDDLVYNPEKAAVATMVHLSQLYKDSGLNLDNATQRWNYTRKGYANSVKDLYNKDFEAYVKYEEGGRLQQIQALKKEDSIIKPQTWEEYQKQNRKK